MPLYRFEIVDPDSDRVQRGICNFPSEDDALEELERRQIERVVPYESPNIDELEAAEDQYGFAALSSRQRGELLRHRQDKPFEISILGEVE